MCFWAVTTFEWYLYACGHLIVLVILVPHQTVSLHQESDATTGNLKKALIGTITTNRACRPP